MLEEYNNLKGWIIFTIATWITVNVVFLLFCIFGGLTFDIVVGTLVWGASYGITLFFLLALPGGSK